MDLENCIRKMESLKDFNKIEGHCGYFCCCLLVCFDELSSDLTYDLLSKISFPSSSVFARLSIYSLLEIEIYCGECLTELPSTYLYVCLSAFLQICTGVSHIKIDCCPYFIV